MRFMRVQVCGFKHKRQTCIDVHDDQALHVLILFYTKNERKNYSYTPWIHIWIGTTTTHKNGKESNWKGEPFRHKPSDAIAKSSKMLFKLNFYRFFQKFVLFKIQIKQIQN